MHLHQFQGKINLWKYIDKWDITGVAKFWRGYLALCGKVTKAVARQLRGEVIKSVQRLPVARLICGEVTCYHNRNRPTPTMLRDIGNGTKSDIPPIYQATVQYFLESA